MSVLLAPLALLIERAIGYPRPLLAVIGHPVMWMGALITFLEGRLNHGTRRRLRGVAMLVMLLGMVFAATIIITLGTRQLPFGFILEAIIASTLIAQMALGHAVKAVADGLVISLEAGRRAVSQIVGRDPDALDQSGVSRAAIESLAESTSDGVIAPLFWLIIGGLPGIALYKAINTADSMVGHLNPRYAAFGWASAKLDDIVNWIPARLTALLVGAAAFLVRGADPEAAWGAALRDARKHASPNAGWPEAAFAGALGFSLGGPRAYDGQIHDLPEFGEGRRELAPADILKSLELYWMVLNVTLGITTVVALLVWWRLA